MTVITTSRGTSISLDEQDGNTFVVLTNSNAPSDMTVIEVGRVIGGGYQPAPFLAGAMTPETLRAIADLIEKEG